LAHQQVSATRPLNRGTVMWVEPDERARCLARFVLNRNGYRVVEADSAAIALVLWESQAARIDLLVTSVELPGELSGLELVRRLRESRASLKVVYTAGGDSADESAVPSGGAALITKPFQPDRLLHQVEQCLARTGG
jgi:CheY-like chemotaxis protein